jgi:sugar phosphate isomerase/epimerase
MHHDDAVIAAALLPFPAAQPDGSQAQHAGLEHWTSVFRIVVDEGFTSVDLTDSWVRVGDLSREQLSAFGQTLADTGLHAAAVSAIRRSVIDPVDGDANLRYSHATIDAAAELGVPIVSVGLHRPVTAEQAAAMWFWTVQGPVDADDADTWNLAVERIKELGRHAADVGVQLSLEMYEDTLLGSADSAVRLVEAVGNTNVGLNPDLGNLYRLHRPIEPFLEALAKCLPHTNYWHVKSYARDEDPTTGNITTLPAPMETGTMDYRTALRMAVEAGFTGPFCVEHYGGDGLSVSARNRDYITRLLRQYR